VSQLLYGINPVREALRRLRRKPLELLVRQEASNPRIDDLVLAARDGLVPVREVPREELDRLAGTGQHQGVALRVEPLPRVSFEALLESTASAEQPVWLALDGITDPHNFGAILRNADAAGCQGVLVPKDRSCPLNATVAKISAGAVDSIPVCQVTNLSRALEQLKQKGFWVYGLAGEDDAQSLYTTDLLGAIVIVIGAEGKGLRPNVRKHCDLLLSIPMLGQVASLNASVATGVALFEALRQRLPSEIPKPG
jgi:23S rRNA (guanosine2251-2'-O)-methyltransferase